MQYIKVIFPVHNQDTSDLLTALLADAGYEGFEETGNELLAYTEEHSFNEEELSTIAGAVGVTCHTELVPAENWNAVWEANFPPVIVDDFCTVRAHFHNIAIRTPYEILITPKMSFGTGHHATTQLMMLMMKGIDFTGKTVLDFGTGTGVLAILAEKLGAATILAIDIDEWCVENANENILRNNCNAVTVAQGSLDDAGYFTAGVVLANINRHILLQYMELLYERLSGGGVILMSGLLAEDEMVVRDAAQVAGFVFDEMRERMNWIILKFSKIIN